MIAVAYLILTVAGALFLYRLTVGPTIPDRVIAADGLLVTVMCGIFVAAANQDAPADIDTVLVVALIGFIATGVLARYVEQRGG